MNELMDSPRFHYIDVFITQIIYVIKI